MALSKHIRKARGARFGLAWGGIGLIATTLGLVAVSSPAHAATDPGLGQANSFGVLSSTYTNTAIGTTINGDLGYTTGPAVAPTVNGTTRAADGTYAQSGIDQGSALASLNSQPCTFTFPAGAVDLATDTSHGAIGIYAPGVYCTTATSAASVGTAGITLTGSGTYIFRINGALTSVANSAVRFASGASACDIWWTPTAATTLGSPSTFLGTDIDASGITIGSTVGWTGRALAFGGTVTTTTDTITVPTCSTSVTSTSTPAATSNPTSTSTPTATSVTTPKPVTTKAPVSKLGSKSKTVAKPTGPASNTPSTVATVPTVPRSPIVSSPIPVTG